MKRHWLLILAVMLITSAFAYEVVVYHEDFESGAEGWVMYDGAESPNNWHIYNYGGAQGNAWWMGDPALASGANIGGYYDRQYLVLDTPARTLTAANANLTFKMRLGLEDPGASGGYDGWDSFNIRVSTDGGNTWNVITGSPAYHFQNSYAFGSEHGEGMGIPGWGGMLTDWTEATFNLSAYVGQSVKIRFAFASDPAYNTSDQPNMFGAMIDDIAFGGYTNNGIDDGEMTWASLVPLGGQLWHIATDPAAPSPTHVMKNQNANGSYNPNMLNYLVSPSITLPSSGDIKADFMIMGNFTDTGTFPDVDFFGWEISPDNGVTWNAMSNPYADPNGSNYVYSDAPDVWMSMIDSYSLDGFISDFAGQTVKFRWYFKSNATVNGTGIMIDDFKIINDVFIAPPENLVATVDGSNVLLAWDAPGSGGGGGEEGWLTYSGENSDSIGTGGAADFNVAAKWDALGTENSIYPYVGMNITKIMFWPNEAASTYAVRVWAGNANTLVVDQPVTSPTIGAWNEITLDTPYTIPAATSVMAGFRCNTTTGYPAGIDAGPTVDGYGNWINLGSWQTLTAAASIEGNWNIKVYVADAQGREYVLGELPQNESYAVGSLASVPSSTRTDRDVNAYRVYRNGIMITELPGTVTEYTEMNVEGGIHNYYLTAVYGTNESPASNTQVVMVIPGDHAESAYDDGSAEMGLTLPSPQQMAVYHDTFSNTSVTLKYAAVYVENLNTAQIVLRIFDVNETTGMPGNMVGTQIPYPAANVIPGWNYIPIPDERIIPSGRFFLSLLVTPNHHAIGVDTSSNGHSYITTSNTWGAYADGEIMMRAIVVPGSSTDDDVAPALRLAASNFPNPFNPTTTISYSVPTNGMTSVKVFNLKGQLINTLVHGDMTAGNHSVVWNGNDANGKNVASGLYFMRVENNGKAVTRKMLLSK